MSHAVHMAHLSSTRDFSTEPPAGRSDSFDGRTCGEERAVLHDEQEWDRDDMHGTTAEGWRVSGGGTRGPQQPVGRPPMTANTSPASAASTGLRWKTADESGGQWERGRGQSPARVDGRAEHSDRRVRDRRVERSRSRERSIEREWGATDPDWHERDAPSSGLTWRPPPASSAYHGGDLLAARPWPDPLACARIDTMARRQRWCCLGMPSQLALVPCLPSYVVCCLFILLLCPAPMCQSVAHRHHPLTDRAS